MTKGWLCKEPREPGRGCGDHFSDKGATQYSNGCRRIPMTKTQLLEHSRGSGLDHEHRLLSGVHRVCELCVFTCLVGRIRRESACCGGWNLMSSRLAWKIDPFRLFFPQIFWVSFVKWTCIFFYQKAKAFPLFRYFFVIFPFFFLLGLDCSPNDNDNTATTTISNNRNSSKKTRNVIK